MDDYPITCYEHDVLPERLREIPQPPRALWARGGIPDPSHLLLTVVGSRKATPYGIAACNELIASLAGLPVSIVSGLALGIDACAHEAALRARMHCIAIPGSGLHEQVLAPAQHRLLATRILAAGGCLLSPFPPTHHATKYSFPARNRIMVGMSHAVLVIEATEKSGTLITARLAAEYNRELGVVPGSIFAPGSAGPHQFLTLGATPIYNAASLRELLGLREAPTLPYSTTTQTTPSLPTHAVQILETLVEPLTVSAIQAQTKLETSTLQAALTLLEIQGYVTRAHGRIQRHQLPT